MTPGAGHRSIRCLVCGRKFTPDHGNDRYCPGCRPRWLRTRAALRAAARPARLEANRQSRRYPGPVAEVALRWAEVLASPCPHGAKLGDCAEPWCRNRVADFELQGGYLPARVAPGEDGGPFAGPDGTAVKVKMVTPFGVVLDLGPPPRIVPYGRIVIKPDSHEKGA